MFDSFKKEKSDFLGKKDKSKKGHIDEDIKGILKEINSKKDYYTTSSCAGRIVLLEMKSRKKNECDWILSKHDKIKFDDIKNILKKYIKNNKIKNNQKIKLKYIGEAERYGRKAKSSSKIAEGRLKNYFKINDTNKIWFKQQPLILHVACRNIHAANRFLDTARNVFKHSGIIGIKKDKVTIETIGSERLETIVADKNFVADNNYLKNLIKYANDNFEENKKKSERFLRIVKNI